MRTCSLCSLLLFNTQIDLKLAPCCLPFSDDDDPDTTDEFQDGSYDKIDLEVPDVGPLRHIRIGHDSEDGWFLRKVRIERKDDAGKGVWDFPCYRWLDPDKDDLCPYRTMVPSQPDDYNVGDASQQAAMKKYTDGVYDSSLCLPQHDCEVTMYEALAVSSHAVCRRCRC